MTLQAALTQAAIEQKIRVRLRPTIEPRKAKLLAETDGFDFIIENEDRRKLESIDPAGGEIVLDLLVRRYPAIGWHVHVFEDEVIDAELLPRSS